MKILKEVYEKMMACPGVPPESGGILGTSDGRIINHVLFDKGLQEDNEGMYYPDISFLNQTIEKLDRKRNPIPGFISHTCTTMACFVER